LEIVKGLGKSIRSFKKAISGEDEPRDKPRFEEHKNERKGPIEKGYLN
jgi:Sec-independent protein translocase protein TatA